MKINTRNMLDPPPEETEETEDIEKSNKGIV